MYTKNIISHSDFTQFKIRSHIYSLTYLFVTMNSIYFFKHEAKMTKHPSIDRSQRNREVRKINKIA